MECPRGSAQDSHTPAAVLLFLFTLISFRADERLLLRRAGHIPHLRHGAWRRRRGRNGWRRVLHWRRRVVGGVVAISAIVRSGLVICVCRRRICICRRGRSTRGAAGQQQFAGCTIRKVSHHHHVVRGAVQQRCQNFARRPRPEAAEDALIAAQPIQLHAGGGRDLMQNLRETRVVGRYGKQVGRGGHRSRNRRLLEAAWRDGRRGRRSRFCDWRRLLMMPRVRRIGGCGCRGRLARCGLGWCGLRGCGLGQGGPWQDSRASQSKGRAQEQRQRRTALDITAQDMASPS